MPFTVLPAEDVDMHRIFEVASSAFLRNEPFWDASYPEHWTPKGRKIGGDRFLGYKQADPLTNYFKAVDSETGSIAGFAKWNVYQNRYPDRQIAKGDYWSSEEEKQYAQHLIDEFNKDRIAHVEAAKGNVVNLDILAIDPAFQRQGVGHKLLEWGLGKSDELDFETIVESSVFGKGLYEKNGFVFQKQVELPLPPHWADRSTSAYAWLIRPRKSARPGTSTNSAPRGSIADPSRSTQTQHFIKITSDTRTAASVVMSTQHPSNNDAVTNENEVLDSWDAESGEDTDPKSNDDESESSQSEDVDSDADAEESDASSEIDSDVDLENEDDEAKEKRVALTYKKLLSRRVDLIGDYAGSELFLLDGDSMLLRCFDDKNLDFSTGLQQLHAVYTVEYFLHALVQRKANFHIAFFDSNRELCLPPSADKANSSKYFLARAAIIHHLQVNLRKAHPTVKVHVFPTYKSDEFAAYLHSTSPYFLMAHDGASAINRKGKIMTSDKGNAQKGNRVALREMIMSFISRGYNVALVNGLEWRDTKVMTMVLETRDRYALRQGALVKPKHLNKSTVPKLEGDLTTLHEKSPKLTERETLVVIAVANQIKEGISSETARFPSDLLLHTALLKYLPLVSRRLEATKGAKGAQEFLVAVAGLLESILQSDAWSETSDDTRACDISDAIDGRLFLQLTSGALAPSEEVLEYFKTLCEAVRHLTSTGLPKEAQPTPAAKQSARGAAEIGPTSDLRVLPFSNPVFDKHMESVKLEISEIAGEEQSQASHKIFREVTHWHNYKRPLVKKVAPTPQEEKKAAKDAFWAAKREQKFMAEMATYAASLTNSIGRSLDPETIIAGTAKSFAAPAENGVDKTKSHVKKSAASSPVDSDASDSAAKRKPPPQKGGKNAKQNAGKQAMLQNIATERAKKDEAAGNKVAGAWALVCKNIEVESDPRARFRKAKDYLATVRKEWKEVVEAEVRLYMLHCLVQFWLEACRQKEQQRRIELVALIWDVARAVMKSDGLTKTIVSCVDMTSKALNLPPMPPAPVMDGLPDRKLAFKFALPTKVESTAIQESATDFQLLHCGPYLERSFDSAPDSRVEFNPDGWQRRVLDGIDANKSLFVVAPTSAGKTFISFYAMRKILEADDDGVLIYIAPTKALVNQIAAEIQARFSKNFKYGGRSVWAIHTRDYRINNVLGAQVIVTVPHVAQILLMAPGNANGWSTRVKRIIFDEVHSIGQAEDGVVWEQLLLLANCPIIALSATVGNPEEFSGWLESTQNAIGNELTTVHHPHRYSDLRKYFYVPPQRFAFNALPAKAAFGTLGLEGLIGFNYVHPVGALVDRSRGIPEDLALEPRDCFFLYHAMKRHQTDAYPMPTSLSPANALPKELRKKEILQWEKDLKDVLRKWMADNSSAYAGLLKELEAEFRDEKREVLQATNTADSTATDSYEVKEDPASSTLPMLCRLHEQDALPAILFNYDRHQCENICEIVLNQLQESEASQRKSGPKWQKTLEKWEQWKKIQLKEAKTAKAASKAKKSKGDDEDGDRESKLDQARDAGGADTSVWDNFNPDAAQEGYHFADFSRVQQSELDKYTGQLGARGIAQWLIDALGRGIGVHHAGMNRKYRQIVEILFRKGFLRVIIATGTLALGINMPCKTVVFSGDSVFLTALNFRQCAGRAGRRGFDLLGNVVFQGISREKVCRLISSRLPDLNGHFPITTTLVLRLFTLLHESKNAKYAISAINALLSQPRLHMGGQSFKDQTMHHLRFSIEYLRRQYLLSPSGATLNFAGLVSHLYFTENSSFAFHALLKEGYFHELCANINKQEKATTETLMLIMAHLFQRIPCRQADQEYREKMKRASSIIFLPPLPKKAAHILREHNRQTLDIFKTYVETFVEQHVDHADRKLPLTGLKAGGEGEATDTVRALPPTHIRSAFVALSGASDQFTSIHDLCQTVRDGVFLEEAVIPHIDVYPDEMEVPLNAWLLDFFKHGDINTIEKANGIRRSDIWFLLNDFSLALATIITSLQNFMKIKEGTDVDMLDVMGSLDAREEAEDTRAGDAEAESEVSGPASSIADSAYGGPVPERPKVVSSLRKAKNADSWEDLADEESTRAEVEARQKADKERLEAGYSEGPAWEKEEGLRNVLKALQVLHAEFSLKFKAMWA
ncbi:hypothetical protein LTR95_003663 [Oleoguttula sp. CCFEE 5521]